MEIFELLGTLNIKGADEMKSKLTSVETVANSLTIKLNKAGDAISSITAKSSETNRHKHLQAWQALAIQVRQQLLKWLGLVIHLVA
jgi:hypothetical protein